MRYKIAYHQENHNEKLPQVIIKDPKFDNPRIIDTSEKLPPLPIKKEDEPIAKEYLNEIKRDIHGNGKKRGKIIRLVKNIPEILNEIETLQDDYNTLMNMEHEHELSYNQKALIQRGFNEKKWDARKRLNNTLKDINRKLEEL